MTRSDWDAQMEHHAGKTVVSVLAAIGCAALAIWSATEGRVWYAVLFALLVVINLYGIKLIRDGRNPWWLRSTFDRPR